MKKGMERCAMLKLPLSPLNVLSADARSVSQLRSRELWEILRKLCDIQPKLPFLLSCSIT